MLFGGCKQGSQHPVVGKVRISSWLPSLAIYLEKESPMDMAS